MTQTDEARWEQGWDGHRMDQLRRLAGLPLAEKLQWLEEAARVVRHLSTSAVETKDRGDLQPTCVQSGRAGLSDRDVRAAIDEGRL